MNNSNFFIRENKIYNLDSTELLPDENGVIKVILYGYERRFKYDRFINFLEMNNYTKFFKSPLKQKKIKKEKVVKVKKEKPIKIPKIKEERKLYQKVIAWLQEYALNPAPETNLTIYLLYFGTSSAKCLLDILKILQKMHLEQKTVANIRWQYIDDDEDMLEAGKNYNEMLQNIQFNFISVTESEEE
jgi:virulence-associated protein VapD